MSEKEIKSTIDGYLKRYDFKSKCEFNENHRFASWHFCYNIFQEYFEKDNLSEEEIKYLSLHLGMYLASWGMMRGSTALIHKSYKIHIETIKKLHENKSLLTQKNINKDDINRIFEDVKNIYKEMKLEKIYTPKKSGKKEWRIQKDYTLLVSKILLGVSGCIPAHDTEFERGIKKHNSKFHTNLPSTPYNNIAIFIDFYEKNIKGFEQFEKFDFPPMKLVDMYFWQLGNKEPEYPKNN